MATFKLQSAMEYLMTYGWAILIIAVVLGALFGLGFFNSSALAPKVTAGSCQVYRPFGPGTTTNINTEGTCNNELPQYVAQFSQAAPGGISATDTAVNTTATTGINTVSFWMLYKGTSTGPSSTAVALAPGTGVGVGGTGGCVGFNSGGNYYGISASAYSNVWIYVTAVMKNSAYSATNDLLYINGVQQTPNCGSSPTSFTATSNVYIGYNGISAPYGQTFNGMVSNVQVYAYALPANDISALYTVGIGGVPEAVNNLAAWYQLNGNGYDYSGNLNNGVPTNVIYTTSWTAAYTAP